MYTYYVYVYLYDRETKGAKGKRPKAIAVKRQKIAKRKRKGERKPKGNKAVAQ